MYNTVNIFLFYEERAKCQTVLKYFKMEKYEYLLHTNNMFVLQKLHITGISHGEKASRFG